MNQLHLVPRPDQDSCFGSCGQTVFHQVYLLTSDLTNGNTTRAQGDTYSKRTSSWSSVCASDVGTVPMTKHCRQMSTSVHSRHR